MKKQKLSPPEIYRLAAEIYEKLPKGQKLEVIEALCNMEGRTAVSKFWLKARVLGVEKECIQDELRHYAVIEL
jgi:hypothetical protein